MNNQMDINVDLRAAETIVCDECGGKLFEQNYVIKRIPKLSVGAPTDIPAPIPIWRCSDCGNILREFIPRGVGTAEELFGDDTPPTDSELKWR